MALKIILGGYEYMQNRQSSAINDLQEMLINSPITGPENLENILNTLQNFEDIRIAIEYVCGECCKTVSNGYYILPFSVGDDILVLLFPTDDEVLCLKECYNSKWIKKELEFIVIPYRNICSYGFYENSDFYIRILEDN